MYTADSALFAPFHVSATDTRPRECAPLRDYLSQAPALDPLRAQLQLPAKTLAKPWAKGLSVLGEADRNSFCFTSGYGKVMHKSAGSFLLEGLGDAPVATHPFDKSDMTVYAGRLRMFSPAELLRLFGFPSGFSFPELLSLRQHWKLVGQSVNCVVVEQVARQLLGPWLARREAASGDAGDGGDGAGAADGGDVTGVDTA